MSKNNSNNPIIVEDDAPSLINGGKFQILFQSFRQTNSNNKKKSNITRKLYYNKQSEELKKDTIKEESIEDDLIGVNTIYMNDPRPPSVPAPPPPSVPAPPPPEVIIIDDESCSPTQKVNQFIDIVDTEDIVTVNEIDSTPAPNRILVNATQDVIPNNNNNNNNSDIEVYSQDEMIKVPKRKYDQLTSENNELHKKIKDYFTFSNVTMQRWAILFKKMKTEIESLTTQNSFIQEEKKLMEENHKKEIALLKNSLKQSNEITDEISTATFGISKDMLSSFRKKTSNEFKNK